jgi:ribonuclease HI
MSKKKYYVVWRGKQPGIYETWDECKAMVEGFTGASYKAFPSESEAQIALQAGPPKMRRVRVEKPKIKAAGQIIVPSIAVDAACSGNPGQMEYRGVETASGRQLFHFGPIFGTNNIGEFLAIVHGLGYLKNNGLNLPIYSDSRNALLWVGKKQCKTTLKADEKSQKVMDYIARAEKWLRENSYESPLLKWETEIWGEIPADFGRKK